MLDRLAVKDGAYPLRFELVSELKISSRRKLPVTLTPDHAPFTLPAIERVRFVIS